MTRCAPPNGHEIVEGYFWLRHKNGHCQVAQWFEGAWFETGDIVEVWPEDMHKNGWTFVCECKEPVE